MKQENRCPGCGKHCPLNAPRCKYGRTYAEKIQKKKKDDAQRTAPAILKKWKKYLSADSVIYQLLISSKQIKQGLRQEELSEEKLLSRISPEEAKTLSVILSKLISNEYSGTVSNNKSVV